MDTGVQKAFLLPALLFVLLYCGALPAQNILNYREVKFHHLTTDNGLPDNIVNKVVQDQKGFIWMATVNGLVRFDGIDFKPYHNIPGDSTSLPDNIVRDIVILPNGEFYLCTNSGLAKFYSETERFEYLHTPKHPELVKRKYNVFSIYLDSKQRAWVLLYKDYVVFDTHTEKVLAIINTENYKEQGWPSQDIKFHIEDKDGYLWFSNSINGFYRVGMKGNEPEIKSYRNNLKSGINLPINAQYVFESPEGDLFFNNNGLFRLPYDKKDTYEFEYIDLFNGRKPITNKDFFIKDMVFDRESVIWIATANYGLKTYKPATQEVSHINIKSINYKGEKSNTATIEKDKNGNVWFLFSNNVLATYDYSSKSFFEYKHNPANPNTPANDYYDSEKSIQSILFQDQAGVYWLPMQASGITLFAPDKAKFALYKELPSSTKGLSGNRLWGMCQSTDGLLWLGIQNSGLNCLDLKTGEMQYFKPEMHSDYEGFHSIMSIAQTSENEYWVGSVPLKKFTYNKINKTLNVTDEFRPSDVDTTRYASWATLYIFQDSYNEIYLGTPQDGMERYVKPDKLHPKGSFKHYPFKPDNKSGIAGGQVWHIMEDTRSRLWISTNGGISLMNKERTEFTNFYADINTPGNLSHPNVKMCFQDRKGRFWIATEGGGLNQYIEEDNRFVHYNTNTGLPTDYLFAVYDDNAGNLWLSSNIGIIRYAPETNQSILFSKEDGLQGSQFVAGAFCRGQDGQIYFGGNGGVNYFYPDSITLSMYIPKIAFTSLKIAGNEILANKTFNGKKFLARALPFTKELVLSYRENMFSVEFAAFDYSAPKNIVYAYKIEGISNDWITTNATDRKIAFNNLPHGRYTITVKSTNADGIWAKNAISLKIVILPPWYKAWWMYPIYMSILLMFFLGYRRMLVIRMRYKNQIEIERLKLKKQQEVERVKTEFFMNVSHEFRTPLTLILGPIEKLVHTKQKPGIANELGLIYRNANRLLRLVNQLLDMRKLETGNMKLQVAQGNIVEFIKNTFGSFQYLAERHRITYKLMVNNFDIASLQNSPASVINNCFFDGDKLEKILYNLLSNAFKYTPDGGNVSVELHISNLTIELRVSDTGIGIESEKLPFIFDRFYQAASAVRKQGGTGIGLALTKQLVQLHHGNINVESIYGYGTTFIITLPTSAQDYDADEIIEMPSEIMEEKYPHITDQLTAIEPNNDFENNKPLILLIDDNTDILLYLKTNLCNNYNLIEATNGKMGLSKAFEFIPDIIICDVTMPIMDGIEFCSIVKADERTNHIPVIMLTARASEQSQIEGLQTGANDYILKPFNVDILLLKINNQIELRLKMQQKLQLQINQLPQNITVYPASEIKKTDDAFVNKMIAIVEKHLANIDFNVDLLASEIGMSKTQFYLKFKALLNQTPNDFILDIRLNKAAFLLKSTTKNVTEVAYEVGFASQPYFSTAFKKKFDVSPAKYGR